MKRLLNIAIFSGAIPSSTFIETLVVGIAQKHKVQLFGVVENSVPYDQPNISIHQTPRSHWRNLWMTLWRVLQLGIQSPKQLISLFQEIRRFQSLYDRWIWFTKFLPIILNKPDILHLQWARDLEFYYFLQTKFNINLLVSLRGAHINYTPIVEPRIADIYKKTFPHISAFHAVSEAMANEATLYGADRSHVKVIRSPLAVPFLNAYRPYTKPLQTTIQLVAVGRFHWIKGYSYLFNALHLLKQQGINVHLNIVGACAYSEELLLQVHQLGLEANITLLGKKPQEELTQLLKKHHSLVLPSLEEGIANVVLEAMAIGVPVVSTDCGGMAEAVIPGETGWLVPVRDPQALADAIKDVSQTSEQDLQRITHNAHLFVKDHFNADERIGEFLKWYEGIVVSR